MLVHEVAEECQLQAACQARAMHLLSAQRRHAATTVQWLACSGPSVGAAMPA